MQLDHETVVKGGLVEKYFLMELTPSQAHEFEGHYFTCNLCGPDLCSTAAFLKAFKEYYSVNKIRIAKTHYAIAGFFTGLVLASIASLHFFKK